MVHASVNAMKKRQCAKSKNTKRIQRQREELSHNDKFLITSVTVFLLPHQARFFSHSLLLEDYISQDFPTKFCSSFLSSITYACLLTINERLKSISCLLIHFYLKTGVGLSEF